MTHLLYILTLATAYACASICFAQHAPITPDLGHLDDAKTWHLVNAKSQPADEGGKHFVRLSPIGGMEGDPLLIQAEQKLINQAEELVLLVDSSKFAARSRLILCPLERVHTIITDEGVSTRDAKLVEQSGIRLIVAARAAGRDEASSSAA